MFDHGLSSGPPNHRPAPGEPFANRIGAPTPFAVDQSRNEGAENPRPAALNIPELWGKPAGNLAA